MDKTLWLTFWATLYICRQYTNIDNRYADIAKITYIARRCLRTAQSTSSECRLLRPRYTCIWQMKCCTQPVRLSVCLSVCRMPIIYSISECRKIFKFIGHLTLDTSNWDCHRFHEWM